MKFIIDKDTTSREIKVFISDSSSLTGAGLTGVAFGDITAHYIREGDAGETEITLATMTVGTWVTGGFKEINAATMAGWYSFGVPDACLAAGAGDCDIHLEGATDMAPLPLEIQLKDDADVLQRTTIDTLASQTSFTLTAGSGDNNAYNNLPIIIEDATTGAQKAVGGVSNYVGSTKGITLVRNPGIFTMAVGDKVTILAGATAGTVWDETLIGSTHNKVNSAGRILRTLKTGGVYDDGAIWIDTENGTAGTVDNENGTVNNPVDSIADANTLAASLGLSRFRIIPGSSITFAADQNNQVFIGDNWTLALGGQDIAGTTIIGALVSGIASGAGTLQTFRDCLLNDVTHIKDTHIIDSGIGGTQTVGEAGEYFLDGCHSHVAGLNAWIWDFGAAIGDTDLNVRSYSGGIQLESMGDTGADTVSIEGWGQIIEGTCTGGIVVVRGGFTVSGITNLTLSDDARFTRSEVADAVVDEVITGGQHNIPDSLARIIRNLRDNGTYEGGQVFIDTVDGSPGTTDGENGTNVNPVKSLADATTIAVSLNLKIFHIVTGSTITLAQTYNNYLFRGHGWTLALGGQDIGGTHVEGPAGVSGVGTGALEAEFHDCEIGDVTLDKVHFDRCGFEGTTTMTAVADYEVTDGYSIDNTTPVFDFGAAVASIDFNATDWQGKIELQNMGQSGTDTANIGGCGDVTINANCVAGTVDICGNMTLTNNGSGQTINDDARVTISEIANAVAGVIGIEKNTARPDFHFLMRDSDGNPKTGLTVAAQRLIDGGVFTATTNSPATEVANGMYKIDLSAADTNGDNITYRFTASGANVTLITVVTSA